MAHVNRVVRSIETEEGGRCVDIFVRPDGTFGFEEYRRDAEDGRGWFAIGYYADGIHDSQEAATAVAMTSVGWLAERIVGHSKA